MKAGGSGSQGIGQPVRRKEDFRLLTGRGCFVDDFSPAVQAHAVLVRSPHAHARIGAIDTAAALAAPGVLAVLTGADCRADGLSPLPHAAGLMGLPDIAVRQPAGAMVTTRHDPLAADAVRFVGEPVALVVADTIDRAKDAAELVGVSYQLLPAVVLANDAVAPGAPHLWDEAPDNVCVEIEAGDEAATAAAFAGAAHIVRLDTRIQRVTGVPMEPRTVIGEYDPTTGSYTLHSGSGRGVSKLRLDLAQVLGVEPERVRVVCGDMGGNFGTRNFFYPEYALLPWAARQCGRLRGIGVSNYVEITSGAPRERAEITVGAAGRVELVMGTMSSGQGHETSFAQLVAEWLGVPLGSIDYVAHDTARVAAGGGSHSGRSMKLAVPMIGQATDDIIARGRRLAGCLMEASEADIEFAAGRFRVAGTDREIGIFEVAREAAIRTDLPAELQGPLAAVSDQTLPIASFPYGTQVCEVEVDPETGMVEIVGYAAVDDVGRAINPLILHGQTHGGIAQGVGQALLEDCHYDPASGQLLAASFMDYAMPRADTFPPLKTALSEVPSPSNRLGVRSGGEGGTTPALAAVINAIVDALSEFGVRHVEMPATPERVWRALRDAPRATG